MAKSLAIKYRPTTFEDVTEQDSIKTILQQQLDTNEWKHAYLFCGPAGCGKTTCARIFANNLGEGKSDIIELDAASNNGVADVEDIKRQAKTKSLISNYKIFILDECHGFSNSAWQQMLKLIEEPPATSIFIFCTTDPQKIPKTIISRVQRYDFRRISQKAITTRLEAILAFEGQEVACEWDTEALEYIAKLAEGGMRDAITMMDKCLSYNKDLTLDSVVTALGTVDYEDMMELTDSLLHTKTDSTISQLETLYASGKDIKQFVKQYLHFLLDTNKYIIGCDWKYIKIPRIDVCTKWLADIENNEMCVASIPLLLETLISVDANIKYSSTPLYDIEAALIAWKGKEI